VLRVHAAERPDLLVDALAAVLEDPPDDPLAPDLVAVHSRGIERWLMQRLSHVLGASGGRGNGVCAGVEFPSPAQVVARALAVAGVPPDGDPWAPARLVWPLLEVVDEHLDEEWLGLLRRHLDGERRRDRRFAAVRRIADLFGRYGVHRPDLVRTWHAGTGTGDGPGAGAGAGAGHHAWQPVLWRHLRAHVGTPSPAERLLPAIAALEEGADPPDLPRRLALFGLTALPPASRDVLRALARHRDVHLLVLHPSAVLWDAVAPLAGTVPRRRAEDPTRHLAVNPLLASWGRDARELQLVLGRHPTTPGGAAPADGRHPTTAPATLLQALQRDVHADAPPTPHPWTGGDVSVQVHACYGRLRQVEVLRDAILHLMADDPTLEPRDVLVMCPDVEAFAPLVEAVFGTAGVATGLPELPVALADRALRQTDPVLQVAATLLDLAASRATASSVLDLLQAEPVRRRFGVAADDVGVVAGWVRGVGVRWGLDGEHRARWGLDGLDRNTWSAGLDRLLVGLAVADDGDAMVGDVVPFDDVEGTDVDLAGRVAEFVARLRAALADLQGPQPVAAWIDALEGATVALAAPAPGDGHAVARVLGAVRDEATSPAGAPAATSLTLAEVTGLLADRLRGRPTRASHRTGAVTVCTLVPMRSVPHRVVCLLGMDDETFPRRAVPDGDDLVALDPHVGDRDPRTEDRQLLLDALLAARDALAVVYSGRDVRTNAERPPCVPVGELLDVVAATAGTDARAAVVRQHPLAAHAPSAFRPRDPWSFDAGTLPAARALAGAYQARPTPAPPFLDGPLAPLPPQPVLALADLEQFLRHPVRAFCTRRLGLWLPDDHDEVADGLPLQLSGLERWALRERALDVARRGGDLDRWRAAELRRGDAPPGRAGEEQVAEAAGLAAGLVAATCAALGCASLPAVRQAGVDVPLDEERALVGAVGMVDDVVLALSSSAVSPRHELVGWVRLLAVAAAQPEPVATALVVGRSWRRGRDAHLVRLGPVEAGTARDLLGHLARLLDTGLREPIPLFERTSWAYARHRRRPDTDAWVALDDAERDGWRDGFDRPREQSHVAHVEVLGPHRALRDVARIDHPTAGDEAGWFGRLARWLWDPLLDVREEEHR